METTTKTNEELAVAWLDALEDVDAFLPLTGPGFKTWHSTDNEWKSVEDAIAAVHDGGGLHKVHDKSYTLTEHGFLVQFSATIGKATLHNTILVKVKDGLAISAEEYVGLEMDVRAALTKQE